MSFWTKIKNKIGQLAKPEPKAMEFRVGEGLTLKQTEIAKTKIIQPDMAMREAQTKSFWGKIKTEFLPREEAVGIRRAFEVEPIQTKAPPIITQLGEFGFRILEAIPKGIATMGGEFKAGFKPAEVKVNIDLRRLGFDSPNYITAAKEQQDAINKGENPWVSGLRIVSQKTLDIAFGAQLVSDLAKLSTGILLKGGVESRIEAQNIVNAYKINQKSAFERLKNAPLEQREKAMADLVNIKNQAEKVLREKGAPSAMDKLRANTARYTEVLGRQTPIKKGFWADIVKPDIGLKTTISKAPVLEVKQLPGTREAPGQAPAFGLSTREVERVGGAGDASQVNKLITEGKIRVVSRDNRDVYQYKKAGEWVNARDEDSAIKQVTKEPYQPKPKIYTPEIEQKIAEIETTLEFTREEIANHPGKQLLKFINRKEGEFLDLKNPDYAKNEYERQRIIARNKKVMRASESAFEGTPQYDVFDDPDVIREAIEDYRVLRQSEKENIRMKREILQKAVPISSKGYQAELVKTKEQQTLSALRLAEKRAPAITEGEARSIEIQAQEALSLLDGESIELNVSLPKIIENTITPVKSKVHFIDTFLTTPHFVMKKIGFGKEAEMLRDAADAYWKELPKNLDVITKWSKRVSKEGNKDIFRYLDGEAITLKPQDREVAIEIKDWLKGWAKRLKLPEDKKISHYITHIFDKEFINKEFDEELAKIIADKIPGQVYDPFLEKRLGKKGYKQDTWAALDAYVKRGTRKAHMDPVLGIIKEKTGGSLEMSNIEKSQFNYIKKYIDNINMRPTEAEEGIDNFIKSIIGYKWGQRPITTILKTLRQMTFRGMLGLNPTSALRNLSQGINTYAVLGEKYTALGYLKLFKRGAGEELAREGVLNAGFIQDRALSATKKTIEKVDKVLFAFFDTAEKINRGAAYFGAKAKALTEKKSEKEAIKYAKSVVRQTQFVFDTVDTPVGMSSDIMKTLLQFQTFTMKQMEFLIQLGKDRNFAGLFRYVLAGIAFVYTIGRAFGMEPKEILPMYRFQTPPSLKLPVEIGKAVFNVPNKYGQERTLPQKLSDIGKAGVGLIPAGSQIKKTTEGISAVRQGGSFDKGGKLQFVQGQTTAQKAQSVIFGKYAGVSAKEYFDKKELNAKEFKKIKPIYEKAQALKKSGNEEEAQSIVDKLSEEEYASYKKYRTKAKTLETIEGKKKMFPKYLEIQKINKTNPEEAQRMVDTLTENEYKYYSLIKKQIMLK